MTGLNLESFLHLLRADLGAWVTLGVIALVLGLMAWTSWGSRRALRKCLVLSVAAHVGLALYGGTVPVALLALPTEPADRSPRERIRQIKVLRASEPDSAEAKARGEGRRAAAVAPWDKPPEGLALADSKLASLRTAEAPGLPVRPSARSGRLKPEAVTAEAETPTPPRPEARPAPDEPPEATPLVAADAGDEVAAAVVASAGEPAEGPKPADRLKPSPEPTAAPTAPRPTVRLEGTLAPALEPSGPDAPAASVADREEPTGEPVPPASSELARHDVAPVEVIPARPDAPRLSPGEADLRARSRPGIGRGGTPGLRTDRPRPPLALAMRPAPAPSVAPEATADRPGVGNPLSAVGPAEPIASTPEGRADVPAAEVVKVPSTAPPADGPPESDVRRRTRPRAVDPSTVPDVGRRASSGRLPLLARVTPSGVPALPEIQGASGGRPLTDVPEVYRSRLDPNRSARAFRTGASPASEQAVERALDWLARHQDADGRWDGGTARNEDGTAVRGDDDFTVHCPPGETCFGECHYAEADTALTGLALLAYLGAGYTQADGKYAENVGKGLDFLRASQKPDGDLRGRSRAVGMYCHAMATIALCEAYALTGDERLRPAAGLAVDFLVRSRARDGLAWRYAPGAPSGDTSILGWVVMALKSAREVGISVPERVPTGALGWLRKVSSGEAHGLARYLPAEKVTPTMTAEAWVCRQFLGAGGPGEASTEAADYLLAHGPRTSGYNLYYWYYGTLAMYQHGGDAWYRWNAQVRDAIVSRQRVKGHPAGSWDPDDDRYGSRGGRLYSTALATLSLEVYYRYLRMYDEPRIPPAMAPALPRGGDRATPKR